MMDLSKVYEFFQPEKDSSRIHIVGCGSVGSTLAENLIRCGVTKLALWDFDTVEEHNIVNQMFRKADVGREKVEALELRQEIVKQHWGNPYVKAVFDFRTLLTSAQHYAADWTNQKQKDALLASMDFSHDEAVSAAPVSACGVTLGVATTVRIICALGVNNYINFVKGEGIWKFVQADGFYGVLDCFN